MTMYCVSSWNFIEKTVMYLFLVSNKRAFESETFIADITVKFSFVQQSELSEEKLLQVISNDKSPDVRPVDGLPVFT